MDTDTLAHQAGAIPQNHISAPAAAFSWPRAVSNVPALHPAAGASFPTNEIPSSEAETVALRLLL